MSEYKFEDIRDFFIRRQYLVHKDLLMAPEDFQRLKNRSQMKQFEQYKYQYLRAFIDGYETAKSGLYNAVKWDKMKREGRV